MSVLSMDVSVQNFEPITVASVRHTGPYSECEEAWHALCGNPDVHAVLGPNTKYLGICYDNPDTVDPNNIRYDACVTIPEEQEFGEGIVTQTVEGGKYAVYTYQGSYEELQEAYRKLYGEWLPQNGHTPVDGPTIEVYLNHPQQTPPEELLTEIRIPLQ